MYQNVSIFKSRILLISVRRFGTCMAKNLAEVMFIQRKYNFDWSYCQRCLHGRRGAARLQTRFRAIFEVSNKTRNITKQLVLRFDQ